MNLMLLGEVASTPVDFSAFITALTNSITPTHVLTIITSVIGVGMTFVLMWLGIRKASSAFTAALFKGKLRV